jgi:uncharacterized protein involved in exopolysaccharide biosynthesis
MSDEFDLARFVGIFKRRILLFGAIVAVTVVCFGALYWALPKKYKSYAQITIYSRYFQNPLIRDFISEQYDPTEMRTQREAVLQQAIDDDFIDQAAAQFHLYKTDAANPRHSAERESLRKRFEIFTLNSDSYQLGFISNDPRTSHDVATLTLAHVIDTLVDQRRKMLINVRDAIRGRMEAMVLFKSAGPSGIMNLATASRAQLEGQLVEVQSQIAGLLQEYTERHPRVVLLRTRERTLQDYLKRSERAKSAATAQAQAQAQIQTQAEMTPDALAGAEVDPGSKEIYQDLLKKYNYLNVALDMEQTNAVNYYAVISEPTYPSSPFAPNLFNLVTYGLGAGILMAIFVLLYEEYALFNAANVESKADLWGLPLLGSLPVLDWHPKPKDAAVPSASLTRNQPNDWN